MKFSISEYDGLGVLKMVEILALATIIAPITWGVLQAVKQALQVNSRYLPLLALIIGVGLGASAVFSQHEIVFRMWAGGISGLAATGLFELGKNSRKDND